MLRTNKWCSTPKCYTMRYLIAGTTITACPTCDLCDKWASYTRKREERNG